uniref:hypothetical protein n=1 Tax=Methanosarcina horonobensis TaxID=418008 RepID=UPI0022B9300A|nr:hypothetical protein [Methanosarcina horonobensis]
MVVVLITETVLLFSFGTYAYSADRSFCAVTADPVSEKTIKSERRTIETKSNECALFPLSSS